ncbi:MAG: radical SAM protein [Deltaproteobacteria bacterium]|nr:radical SAM protein [Deltaproteobacteria bacterium]
MKIENHPCFNGKSRHEYGRIHLPVAPKCNIQCNFCNKRYDCVSESRPGVTSSVLTPAQSMAYLNDYMEKSDNISVVGIAGPGDPFANAEDTMETLRLVRAKYPEILLCIATNGLEIEPWIPELVELKISHVTMTINAVNVEVATNMYSWVRYNKKMYRGEQAGKLLIEKQHSALKKLVETDMIIKVNTVVVPGKNDFHIDDIGNYLLEMGVDVQNCMSLKPIKNTPFENIPEPDPVTMGRIRLKASGYVEQMSHCQRCRADAAGLITDKCIDESNPLEKYARMNINPSEHRPNIAVISKEGFLINNHLGEAYEFLVYGKDEKGDAVLVEKRPAPEPGSGNKRWENVSEILKDCSSLLVGDIGPTPSKIITDKGIKVWRVDGIINDIVPLAINGGDLTPFSKSEKFSCGGGSCGAEAQVAHNC